METRQMNWLLIAVGIVLIILAFLIDQLIQSWGPTFLVVFMPIAWILVSYGALNFTALRQWLKFLLAIVIGFVLAVAFVLLIWGIQTGFTYAK